jgi:hypothetical protein
MSQFYASVSNGRSTITKCGHTDGLTAHIRGWTKGFKVRMWFDPKTKVEYYQVYETSGSNGTGNDRLIKSFEVDI